MTSKRMIPVACTLGPTDAVKQLEEWAEVRTWVTGLEQLPDGVRLLLPPERQAVVVDLAEREATCCAFLTLTTAVVDGVLRLDITSDQREARPVIDLLAGTDG
ncbi:MAG: hypothetical protein AAGD35_10370 [Actinomycetota bacterium]